jgi:hypothetical protein
MLFLFRFDTDQIDRQIPTTDVLLPGSILINVMFWDETKTQIVSILSDLHQPDKFVILKGARLKANRLNGNAELTMNGWINKSSERITVVSSNNSENELLLKEISQRRSIYCGAHLKLKDLPMVPENTLLNRKFPGSRAIGKELQQYNRVSPTGMANMIPTSVLQNIYLFTVFNIAFRRVFPGQTHFMYISNPSV